jgi:Family of unknown function (DUF6585)
VLGSALVTTTNTGYLPQSLPPQAISVAIEQRLGAHVATYPRAKSWKRIIAGLVVIVMLLLVGLLVATDTPLVLLVLLPVILLLGGVVVWLMMNSPVFSAKARARPFHAFANGYMEFAKTGPVAHRWDQMQTVYQEITTIYVNGVNTGTKYIYKMALADGRQVKLTSDQVDMTEFGPLIQRGVVSAQAPRVVEALRAGQPVAFGDVTVTPTGVRTRKGDLPWAEISNIRVVRGYFAIDRAGKKLAFFNKPCKSIPNLYTLMAVLGEGVQKQGWF